MPCTEINKTPLTKPRFKFVCNKMPLSTYFCQTVSLPSITLGETEFENPILKVPMPGDKLIYEDLSFSFVVNEDLDNWAEIKDWLSDAGYDSTLGTTNAPWSELFADGSLIILSDKMNPIGTFTFEDMFPVSLGTLEFDITDTNDEVITANVSFKYTKYSYKTL